MAVKSIESESSESNNHTENSGSASGGNIPAGLFAQEMKNLRRINQ